MKQFVNVDLRLCICTARNHHWDRKKKSIVIILDLLSFVKYLNKTAADTYQICKLVFCSSCGSYGIEKNKFDFTLMLSIGFFSFNMMWLMWQGHLFNVFVCYVQFLLLKSKCTNTTTNTNDQQHSVMLYTKSSFTPCKWTQSSSFYVFKLNICVDNGKNKSLNVFGRHFFS